MMDSSVHMGTWCSTVKCSVSTKAQQSYIKNREYMMVASGSKIRVAMFLASFKINISSLLPWPQSGKWPLGPCCLNLAPKSHTSRPEGPCPQLALTDNNELLYGQWLGRKMKAGLLDREGKSGREERQFGKQKEET